VLLDHGAKVNAAGGEEYLSPLHDAASANFTEMVKLLLKYGADPKQLSIKGETSKYIKSTRLH
jgi:ankyrin repeat protein